MRIVLILLFISLKSFGQWTLVPCPSTLNLNSVHFGNENTGYIAGTGVIMKTTNQGITWFNQLLNGPYFNFYGVHCSDPDTVFVGAKQSFLGYKTYDGGNTPWLYFPYASLKMSALYSISSKFIYFVGGWSVTMGSHISYNGGVIRTKNGGGEFSGI